MVLALTPSIQQIKSWNSESNNNNIFDFSLILACYCESPHLYKNVELLAEYLSATIFRCEIIFVEDSSPDDTFEKILQCEELLRKHKISYQILRHPVNMGRGATVQDGFIVARGDVVGYIDIDLEHPMDALLSMLIRIRKGECDAVVAHRVSYKKFINPLRTWMSEGYKALVHRLLALPVADTEAGLKLFNREKILPVLAQIEDKAWFWDTEIVHRAHLAGLVFGEQTIVFKRNIDKKSTVRVFRDSWVYFKTLLKYSQNKNKMRDKSISQYVKVSA